MNIVLKRTGGIAYFPGLAKPVEIDTEKLSSAVASELHRVIEKLHFFDLPAKVSGQSGGGAADLVTYTIEIRDGARQHTVQITDPIPAETQRLVELLSSIAKAQR
jgi:hypothetical protein